MGMFSRPVDAVLVALSWTRTVVIEQEHWEFHRKPYKPRGDNVRNLRAVQQTEPDLVWTGNSRLNGAGVPKSKSREVLVQHTYFEYEERVWRKRSFSARGDDPADVRWPEYTLGPGQRIGEQRETYRAKFTVPADGGEDEYVTELDPAVWRTLKIGKRYRLKVGALGGEIKQVTPARRDGR
jgi:hypothetical protein